MSQIVYTGTADADLLDASGVAAGYLDGTEVHAQTLANTNYSWTTATLNWTDVDEVRFFRAGVFSDFSADSFQLI